MRLAGMMSGTSLDGIDVAIIDLERDLERPTIRLVAFETVAFEPQLRAAIINALPPRSGSVRDVCVLNVLIGEAFATALLDVARRSHIDMETIDGIGSHGHTLRHIPVDDGAKPFAPSTLQIGDPAVIAACTGVTCVGDFRVADIAAGGQGAPLASYVDYLLLRSASEFRVALNVGGIANLTLLPRGCGASEVVAFDSGPGNVLIDACARFATDGKLERDEDGRLARQGKVDEQLLRALLDHPFYRIKPPKTAGREQFGEQYAAAIWQQGRDAGLTANDALATVTALTARTLAAAVPGTCDRVIVSGGGAHNPVLMDSLRRLQPTISPSDEFGLPVDGKEAIVFAVLAFEALAGQPNNLPSATGAAQQVVMGKIAPGKNFTSVMSASLG